MKIFFDTEFIDNGKTIELLSIGMVREDDKRFYAEAAWTDRSLANAWVQENVLPKLNGTLLDRRKMQKELIDFAGENPEFWAYYAAYDWVVLCQVFGTMMDLPITWPKYCRDFKQWLDSNGNPKMVDRGDNCHNALADALHLKDNFELLTTRALVNSGAFREVALGGYDANIYKLLRDYNLIYERA